MKDSLASKPSKYLFTVLESNAMPDSDMGYETVNIYIGDPSKKFTIHKNLLCATGTVFDKMYNSELFKSGCKVVMNTEDPAAFKLFVDYLYSRRVPGATTSMSIAAQSLRVKQLCQLYAYADKLEMNYEIRNKIMDKIQDGFTLINVTPEPGLLGAIYSHTSASSQLRKFCAASLVYNIHRTSYVSDGSLAKFLTTNAEMMEDFLEAVRNVAPDQDPRVRDCKGHINCIECVGKEEREIPTGGVWPCLFHLHDKLPVLEGSKKEDGADNSDDSTCGQIGEGCHLWYS